jgi:hypothetical protein
MKNLQAILSKLGMSEGELGNLRFATGLEDNIILRVLLAKHDNDQLPDLFELSEETEDEFLDIYDIRKLLCGDEIECEQGILIFNRKVKTFDMKDEYFYTFKSKFGDKEYCFSEVNMINYLQENPSKLLK